MGGFFVWDWLLVMSILFVVDIGKTLSNENIYSHTNSKITSTFLVGALH